MRRTNPVVGFRERSNTATTDNYYLHDPRLVLIPIEGLTPTGLKPAFADWLHRSCDWSAQQIQLIDTAFDLYWRRTDALATQTRTWMPPRLRHIGLIRDPWSVRPYVQILNTSAWLLYECDIDAHLSTPEFLAYLLVHGDRMAITREVTAAALRNGAYWIGRTDEDCSSFIAGAERSQRPDADAFRALATALPWLRQLAHETLRPPRLVGAHRAIPATGLFVRKDLEAEPARLLERWTDVANSCLSRFRTHQAAAHTKDVARLCDWLAATKPDLLVCGQRERVIWDPNSPERIGALRNELKPATAAALKDIGADLEIIHAKTTAFHRSLRDPKGLPAPSDLEHRGYTYLHKDRGLIAYNLYEPGLERLQGPSIPYARSMLAARTIHEWCHLAVDAGWVPLHLTTDAFLHLVIAAAERLDGIVNRARAAIRNPTAADLRMLLAADVETEGLIGLTRPLQPSIGVALVRIVLRRLADYQANMLAQRFLSMPERETYVRQNVRHLRSEFPPEQLWRMLVRYLYEYQYLSFSSIDDAEEYFLRSTWFDTDFIATETMDRAAFRNLVQAIAAICSAFSIDESRFQFEPQSQPAP